MTSSPSHLFWDSCVFTAFLCDQKHAYDIESIAQYIDEAQNGQHRIYTSSIVLTEVLPSYLKPHGLDSFFDFIEDMRGSVVIVDASVNIVGLAGSLRDLPYKKEKSNKRRLHTPDAIMLATCLHIKDALGVPISAFHTFDRGGKRDPIDGKAVPLLNFEEWCEGLTDEEITVARRVIELPRRPPLHPSPRLPHVAKAP